MSIEFPRYDTHRLEGSEATPRRQRHPGAPFPLLSRMPIMSPGSIQNDHCTGRSRSASSICTRVTTGGSSMRQNTKGYEDPQGA